MLVDSNYLSMFSLSFQSKAINGIFSIMSPKHRNGLSELFVSIYEITSFHFKPIVEIVENIEALVLQIT